MNRIEKGLHEHHATAAANPSTATAAAVTSSSSRPATSLPSRSERPFAKVNTVESNSPAQAAGLQIGDTVLRFGSATYANNEKLSKVAEIVSQNEGTAIPVKVSRLDAITQMPEEVSLQLTPRRDWGGRGLLGCHLLPL
jgi:26S proteasome regulatory subunit N4